MTHKQEAINKQVYKNYLLIKEYQKLYYSGILSNEFLDKLIDRLIDNSIYLINPEPSDALINYFNLIVETDSNYYEDTLFYDLKEYYGQ
jgi:hypothetical protein